MLFLSACGGQTSENAVNPPTASDLAQSSPSVPDATAPSDISNSVSTGVIARVNGVDIRQDQLDRTLNLLAQGAPSAELRLLRDQAIDALIEQELLRQAALTLGIRISPEEANAELLKIKGAMPTKTDWTNYLQMNGLDEADLLAAQYDALLTQRLRDSLFSDLNGNLPQVRARHILLRSEDEAKQALTQLQNGADFGALAQRVSADTSTRDVGGDLGWFTREELLDGQLAEVAFSLELGAIAGPIPSSLGYHIIQVMERAERGVEAERMAVLMETRYNNWLQQQWQTATIEIVR